MEDVNNSRVPILLRVLTESELADFGLSSIGAVRERRFFKLPKSLLIYLSVGFFVFSASFWLLSVHSFLRLTQSSPPFLYTPSVVFYFSIYFFISIILELITSNYLLSVCGNNQNLWADIKNLFSIIMGTLLKISIVIDVFYLAYLFDKNKVLFKLCGGLFLYVYGLLIVVTQIRTFVALFHPKDGYVLECPEFFFNAYAFSKWPSIFSSALEYWKNCVRRICSIIEYALNRLRFFRHRRSSSLLERRLLSDIIADGRNNKRRAEEEGVELSEIAVVHRETEINEKVDFLVPNSSNPVGSTSATASNYNHINIDSISHIGRESSNDYYSDTTRRQDSILITRSDIAYGDAVRLKKIHQLANIADVCNFVLLKQILKTKFLIEELEESHEFASLITIWSRCFCLNFVQNLIRSYLLTLAGEKKVVLVALIITISTDFLYNMYILILNPAMLKLLISRFRRHAD